VVKPAWGAIFAIAFGVVVLTAAQTLPVSLLTPLAADLRISEGLAGQTVTATSAVAFVTSLIIAFAARNLDRRVLLLVLALLQVVSNLLVAVAPNLSMLLLGRMLLATTQLAITLGAAAGGIAIDRSGAVGAVVVSGIVLLLASVVTALGLRARSASPANQAASGLSA
jgi:predicted MFS family arabinose efflux permease